MPASALEPLVLAARVRDYEPSYLDVPTAAGEVLWAGHVFPPGADGWVSLHLADQAPLTLPEHEPFEHSELHQAVLDALAPGGAWFFRQLAQQVGSTHENKTLSATLWDLVWSGLGQQRHPHAAPRAHPLRHPQPPHEAAARPTSHGLDHGPRRRLAAHRAARDRRPLGRCSPSSTPTPPAARTQRPSGCSTDTAS